MANIKLQLQSKMFIKYLLKQQILISAGEYTQNSGKAVRNCIFGRYLFKIVRIPGLNNNESAEAICVKIQSIQIIDNIILRKSADMKVKVLIGILVLRLVPDQYFQGTVDRCDAKGIVVKFIGGLMEGTINLKRLHKDTIYNEEKNQWILATGEQSDQGYEWKIGAHVRFRIHSTHWQQQYQGTESQRPTFADLVQLKANQAGLGPSQWWL